MCENRDQYRSYIGSIADIVPGEVQIIAVGEVHDGKAVGDIRLKAMMSPLRCLSTNLSLFQEPTGSSVATLIYTSGTTGEPKAIEVRHSQLMVACRSLVATYSELGNTDTTFCWLPMSALFQRIANLFCACLWHAVISHGKSSLYF